MFICFGGEQFDIVPAGQRLDEYRPTNVLGVCGTIQLISSGVPANHGHQGISEIKQGM